MKAFLRVSLLLLLTFFGFGLTESANATICMGPNDCFDSSPSQLPRKFHIAVPDLLSIAESPDRNATALLEHFRNNLALTGLFHMVDNRAFPDDSFAIGQGEKSAPDYKAWGERGVDFLVKGRLEHSTSQVTLELRLFDIAAKRPIMDKRYVGKPGEARKMTNDFTNTTLEALTGTPGVFGSEIVFASGRASKDTQFYPSKQIFKTRLGGDEVVQITDSDIQFSTMPTIGPGGSLAWIRRDRDKEKKEKPWELVRDGHVISSGDQHLSPAFMPSGAVAAAVSGPRSTAIYSFSGRNKNLLVDTGGIAVSPTFSPDGSRMAYVSDQGGVIAIYIASASGEGEITRLTAGAKATDPAWSPTGEFIAFGIRETDICIIRPDGTGFRQLTGGQGINMRPSFSPDGRMIVFSSTRNGRSQLFVMSADGDNPQPLLPKFPGPQEQPFWSPVQPMAWPSQK